MKFGGVSVNPLVVSSTTITAQVPAGFPNYTQLNISVTTAAGSASAGIFTITPLVSNTQNNVVVGSDWGGGQWLMSTSATFDRNALNLTGATKVQSTEWFAGFHGSVSIVVTNPAGQVVGYTQPLVFGVDANSTWGPGGWGPVAVLGTDPATIRTGTSISVVQMYDPQNQLGNWLQQAIQYKKQVCQIYQFPGIC